MTIDRVPDRASFITKTQQRVQSFLKASGALWTWAGHKHIAQLSSGRLSNFYADCSPMFTNPNLQDDAGRALGLYAGMDQFEEGNYWIVACSPGALGLAQSIARAFNFRPAYVEPASDLGLKRFDLGKDPVLFFCDDVVTTGETIIRAREAVFEVYPKPAVGEPALVLVDRMERDRLPENQAKLKVVAMVKPHARTWVNDRALPGAMRGCVSLSPKGNWAMLNGEMLEDA